jgi:hypothetical protein
MVAFQGLSGRSGPGPSGLEVPGGVEGELAEELAGVAVDDPDVQVVDEQGDRGAGERRTCRGLPK